MHFKLLYGCILAASILWVALSGNTGFAECPCINPNLPQRFQQNSTCPLPVTIDNVVYCYPADYGASTCQAWDYTLAPECADASGTPKPNAPDWCSGRWCFVANSCRYKTSWSAHFRGVRLSYGTCGDVDKTIAQIASMEGAKIRVHTLNEPPMVYPDRTESHPVGRGLVWDLYSNIFQSAGMYPFYKDLLPYNGSAWDACIRDVALGALDLCLGTFWETAPRRDIASFISPFGADNFFLVVRKVDEVALDVLSVFRPFNGWLWLCIAVMIVFIATMIYFLERAAQGPDHPHFSGETCFEGSVESTYLACVGFWSAGVAHESVTPGGRMVTLAFAVFVVLTIAGYTANLAAFILTPPRLAGEFNSVHDVVKNDKKLCMWGSVVRAFRAGHADIGLSSIIQVSSTSDAMEKLKTGECGGVVNSKTENDNMLSQAAYCNMTALPDPLMVLMLAQPVKDEYAKAFSYWLVKKGSEKIAFAQRYQSQNFCREQQQSARPLELHDFYGTILVTAIAVILGLLIRFCRWAHAKYYGKEFHADPRDVEEEEENKAPAGTQN